MLHRVAERDIILCFFSSVTLLLSLSLYLTHNFLTFLFLTPAKQVQSAPHVLPENIVRDVQVPPQVRVSHVQTRHVQVANGFTMHATELASQILQRVKHVESI